MTAGGGREAVHQRPAVGDPLDVGETDRGGVVGGVPAEVVGDRDGGGVAPDTARLIPTPESRERLRNVDTKLPLWLATPMLPAGGYGATIWAHRFDRRADDALTVRPCEQDAEFVGQRDELAFGSRPSSPASP